jgi:hypothetical protein
MGIRLSHVYFSLVLYILFHFYFNCNFWGDVPDQCGQPKGLGVCREAVFIGFVGGYLVGINHRGPNYLSTSHEEANA